ncbi:MAG: HAD family phosphatase [Clostridiales bacterium]|nr:HAD family phosphatase [Clostridiales bacterium]
MIHVFDIDGTLLDSLPMWNRLSIDLLGRHGIVIMPDSEESAAIFRKLDPITSEQGAAWICEAYINPRGTLPEDAQRTPEEVYGEMTAYLETQYREILQPFPDTLDTLRGLHDAGETIIAFSSTDEPLIRAALARIGVLDWFKTIYTTPQIGYNKVSPMAFAEVAKREGAKPEDLIVYEDTDFAIAAATLAGCLVINCSH